MLPFYSLGALVVPVTTEFGWTRAEFQLATLFSTGTGILTAPVVGWLVDQYGSRIVALIGLVGLSLAFALAAAMNGQLFVFYLVYTLMALLGAGTIPVTWTRAITSIFIRQRGLALGIMLSGAGVSGIIIPQYTVWLIGEFGWRAAYLGLAGIPILFATPLVYFYFHPNESPGSETESGTTPINGITLTEAIRGYRFWVLLFSIFFVYMAMAGLVPNLIPALTDKGLDPQKAATVVSIFGFTVIAGRLIVGYFVDHYWAPGVAAIAIFMPVMGALILYNDPGFYLACIAAGLLGIAAGAELDIMSFLAARYFGLLQYARIYAFLYAALALATGLSPALVATIFDLTGGYNTAFALGSVFFAAGAILILFLGRYPEFERQGVSRGNQQNPP